MFLDGVSLDWAPNFTILALAFPVHSLKHFGLHYLEISIHLRTNSVPIYCTIRSFTKSALDFQYQVIYSTFDHHPMRLPYHLPLIAIPSDQPWTPNLIKLTVFLPLSQLGPKFCFDPILSFWCYDN